MDFSNLYSNLAECRDLLLFAELLNEFIKAVKCLPYQKKSQQVKELHRFVSSTAENYMNIGCGRCNHYVLHSAPIAYLHRKWPCDLTPAESVLRLESIVKGIHENIIAPEGERISRDSLSEIMQFVNNNYHYCERVLDGEPLYIFHAANSHKSFGCTRYPLVNCRGKIAFDLIAFHLNKEFAQITPEYAFLHELGILLYAKVANFPLTDDSVFMEYHPPTISQNTILPAEQFAEYFVISATYHSPLSRFDPYPEMTNRDKQAISRLVCSKVCIN